MFQWCFAHSLNPEGKFYVDLLFDGPDEINHQLDFQLPELVAKCSHIEKSADGTPSNVKLKKFWHGINYVWLIHSRLIRYLISVLGYYRENPNQSVAQSKFMPRKIRYAYGYFQSNEIVADAWRLIESELSSHLQNEIDAVMNKFEFESKYTVVHVRRYPAKGYKHSPIHFSNLSNNFFLNWVQEHPAPNLVLLTEKADEVSELISLLMPSIVLDKDSTSAWETLAIMANSTSMLGSNSTLSWWGAKFASDRGGAVWLPTQWSYWENVDMNKILLESCNVWEADWDISDFD